MAGYVNLDTIYRAAPDTLVPHQWADQVNDNSAFFNTGYNTLTANFAILQQLANFSSVYRNSGLSILNNTDTNTNYDTVDYDPAGLYNFTAHLWVAPVPGLYLVSAQSPFGSGTGQTFVGIFHNYTGSGGPTWAGNRFPLGVNQGAQIIRAVHLAAGDTVGIDTWQNSGGTLAMAVGSSQVTFGQFGLLFPDAL